jgi:GntR family transcriptional regulator
MAAARTMSKTEQVTAALRARIVSGQYPPGTRVPTEDELIKEFGYSGTTVRNAILALRATGLVETRHGSGTYVVEPQLLRIHATLTEDLDRRQQVRAQDAWQSDVIAAGHTPSQRFELLLVTAATVPDAAEAAKVLRADLDDVLTVRRCWRSVDEAAASIETSWFPAAVTSRLPRISTPVDITEGTTVYLAENGYPHLWHQDEMEARAPSEEELTFIGMPLGIPVLVRYRTTYARPGGEPIRFMRTAYRGDRHRIVYDVAGRGNVAYGESKGS